MNSRSATMTDSGVGKRKASTACTFSHRPVKRRASNACCNCRTRHVRCDVVRNGPPCTNCRLDVIECIVKESKWRKKLCVNVDNKHKSELPGVVSEENPPGSSSGSSHGAPDTKLTSLSRNHVDIDHRKHMPLLPHQSQMQRIGSDDRSRRRMASYQAVPSSIPFANATQKLQDPLGPNLGKPHPASGFLPDYIRSLPAQLQNEDIDYLAAKGALTIPGVSLRNELLKAYIHYVHTYMPLLDLEEFLQAIVRNDGIHCISLLLFQAVMFAGIAFVDVKHLQDACYPTRKMARKIFFQRARLLYDFEYEVDRISLVQSLLLMTCWYETCDDQKDAWHWMGVALSLAYTIGLHRDPSNSRMDVRRQRMWKRIWWSTYTRDRLIALGMRRPMRVEDDKCDVPMLTLDDFELKIFSPEIVKMVQGSEILHNVSHQRELALMFIEKAKLSRCVSHVLSTQYSMLNHELGHTLEATMMLVPKKLTAETFEVRHCDQELEDWLANLPVETQNSPSDGSKISEANEVLFSHRAMLKMAYFTTCSALHLPQVLPATQFLSSDTELLEMSRKKVRVAAIEITNIAQDLHVLDLTRYYATTGVPVLLPVVVIHLLDIESSDPSVRMTSLRRFYHCMRILQHLRKVYASADFAASFLEAAIHKAGVQLIVAPQDVQSSCSRPNRGAHTTSASIPLLSASARNDPSDILSHPNTLTPPQDSLVQRIPNLKYPNPGPAATCAQPNADLLASTPPHSHDSENCSTIYISPNYASHDALDFPDLLSEVSLTELIDLGKDGEVIQTDDDAMIHFGAGGDFFAKDVL